MIFDRSGFNHPVLIFNNGIGDHIINLPAIRALSHCFEGKLVLVCAVGTPEIFFANIEFTQIVEIDFFLRDDNRDFYSDEVVSKVDDCDLLISLNPWHSPELARLAKHYSAEIVGFFPEYDYYVRKNSDQHSALQAFDIVRLVFGFDVDISSFSFPPQLPVRSVSIAQEIRNTLPSTCRLLTIHADTGHEKMWESEKFTLFIDAFLEQNKSYMIFIVGAVDLGLTECKYPHRVVSCVGLDLSTSLALVSLSDLFVGVDSCMLHAADVFQVPTVGLFVSTPPHEFGQRINRNSIMLYQPNEVQQLDLAVRHLISRIPAPKK